MEYSTPGLPAEHETQEITITPENRNQVIRKIIQDVQDVWVIEDIMKEHSPVARVIPIKFSKPSVEILVTLDDLDNAEDSDGM